MPSLTSLSMSPSSSSLCGSFSGDPGIEGVRASADVEGGTRPEAHVALACELSDVSDST